MNELRDALIAAAAGERAAVTQFFSTLLRSEVYVPLQTVPVVNEGAEARSLVATGTDQFITVRHHGHALLPIFSAEALVMEWTDQEQLLAKKPFSALLWLVPSEHWLHLDPGSDIGKEFSPWEIELLREGESAVEEVISDLLEDNQEVLAVEDTPPAFAALKEQLRYTFEAYPEIFEGFLVAGQEEETREAFPIVLLKQDGLSFEKRRQLGEEIESATEAILGRKMVSIIDDIGRDDSPNRKLLVGFTPFYMVQRTLPTKSAAPGFFVRLKARFFRA